MKAIDRLREKKFITEELQEEINLQRLEIPKKKRRKGKKKETFNDFVNRLLDENSSSDEDINYV